MRLPQLVRARVGDIGSQIAVLPGVKTAVERAPSLVVSSAIKGVEIGLAGYGVARRVAVQFAGAAHAGIAVGKTMIGAVTSTKEAEPAVDPWSGGPLQPVDDIRSVVSLTEADAAQVEELADGETLAHDDLPLEDYDHMTLGVLRSRMRKLTVGELVQLREYEHAHANRLPIVKMFDNRLAALAALAAPAKSSATTHA